MTLLQVKNIAQAEELIKRRRTYRMASSSTTEAYVEEIIRGVQAKGDTALIDFTQRFDRVDLTKRGVRVAEEEIKKAYKQVNGKEISALKRLKKRIEKVERHKLKRMKYTLKENGLAVTQTLRPLESVGCYVPGGEAAYPSTLLMTATPAKVANVPRIVVCSPPTDNGEINPRILAAASICEVDEVYQVGGAQAIGALAYGTESIKSVAKIVGPGNRFVTLAKVIVSKDVAIDLPAGPSEILILADETAELKFIALDLISQAEHTSDNVAGLVTTSEDTAIEVVNEVEKLVPKLSRSEIVTKSLSENGFVFLCKDMDEAISFVNAFAPEHLEIVTRKPRKIAEKITSAGIVLLGRYTPVAASDYCIGTNHVLPTAGYSRVYSELSVFDYVRRMSIVECSKEKLRSVIGLAKTLAYSEELPNHFLAIQRRFRDA